MYKPLLQLSLAASLALSPLAAYALPPTDPIDGLAGGGGDATDLTTRIGGIITKFLGILGIIAVIVIIIAGFRLIVSGGNEETARSARRQILYAVIGLIVILLSVIIVNFVISLVP